MHWKTRLILRESLLTAFAFTVAAYFYFIFSVWGFQDHFTDWPLQDYLTSAYVHVELLIVGILFGVGIAIINRFTDNPKQRKLSILRLVFYRTILYVSSFCIISGVVVVIFIYFIYPWEVIEEMFLTMSARYAVSFVLWIIVVVGSINMILEMERIVGPRNMWRLLTGRHRQPSEELRILLFMDLVGSTTVAEELGHMRYSEFLQECFQDLSPVVVQFDANIYQYVGDEVVMSWTYKSGKNNILQSLRTFFSYQELLKKKENYYRTRFGITPRFRGGIDFGKVTTIEVGDVKREIAYHGDVLNTTARLLELAKEKNQQLMVSEEIGAYAQQHKDFVVNWSELVHLRGKKYPVKACSIQTQMQN